MSVQRPKYPLKTQLPEISNHNRLPPNSTELARIQDTVHTTRTYVFVKNKNHLTILTLRYLHLKNGVNYFCIQNDFPMEFLNWFSHSLSDFRKSPAEGGLHSGGICSADQNVNGEILCIQRTMGSKEDNDPGYAILNRSRCKRSVLVDSDYIPQRINFSEEFIFNGGLLDLIQDLSDKYQRGEI